MRRAGGSAGQETADRSPRASHDGGKLGQGERVAAEEGVGVVGQHQQAEAERPRPAGVIDPTVGDLDDGDVLLPEGTREGGRGAADAGRPLAEAGTEALRLGQPLVEEAGRAGQEAVAARVVAAVEGLFDEDIGHVK